MNILPTGADLLAVYLKEVMRYEPIIPCLEVYGMLFIGGCFFSVVN